VAAEMIDQLATPLLGGRPIFCGDRLRESFENPEKIKWSDQAKAPLEVRLFWLFKLVASFARYRRVEA